jgi:predicted TIM-barrel fold metal-dependent hydrolase
MAKKFFEKYQDRILFGKDSWVPAEYATYFHVLETEDEYFPYHKKYHAFWPMYGMGLSDEVLKKVYYKNAERNDYASYQIIDKTLFPGQTHEYLVKAIKHVKESTPGRIIQFTNISFEGVGKPGWTENAIKELENDVKAGANGLKIFRELGLTYKDNKGNFLHVDDERLDPIWEKCRELKMPVIIHTAAPKSFWDPADEKNERWLEVTLNPDRKYYGTAIPSWEDLIQQQHNIIRKHPKTIFITAHFGWYANDLGKLGSLLDSFPNMNIEFGAVIAELGRQPRMAKQFFEKYQDRILFGKDNWIPAEYATYFRVLETEDEYFPYHKKYHAFWPMYGMGLSDEVLKKVYYKNALRIIPNIDKSLFGN